MMNTLASVPYRKIVASLATLLVLTFPYLAAANCMQFSVLTAPTLFYDATSALNLTGYASFSGSTNYPGSFTCSPPAWGVIGGQNNVDNSTPYSRNTLYLKFPGNAFVSMTITHLFPQEVHPRVGFNSASSIDANFTVNLQLMKTPPTQNVKVVNGDTATIDPIVLAQDSTGLTIIQNISRMIADFTYFIVNWNWPKHNYDIYYKPLQIKFVKYVTTCSFDDNNKTVELNNVSLAMLARGDSIGKAFTLNFTCTDLLSGETTRNLSVFLSSNSLSKTDPTTLTSSAAGSAGGVGIRITRNDIPLKISPSASAQNDATPLFSYAANQTVEQKISIPLTAWYQVYNRQALSSGPVRATAVVNFVYD